jgi:hypothetical protein
MALPYRARLNEQTFLNLPGMLGGAYVFTYVEDTSERGLEHGPYCEPGCTCGCADNFEPRMVLEIGDGRRVVDLGFDVDSEAYRENSLHKLDTLIAALRVFRAALVEEFEPYDRRARELAGFEDILDEPPGGTALRPSRPT